MQGFKTYAFGALMWCWVLIALSLSCRMPEPGTVGKRALERKGDQS